MKQSLDKNNSLSKYVNSWKDKQGIKSLSRDELAKEAKPDEIILSEKIDGELNGLEFNGKDAKLGSTGGRVRKDLPVLDEVSSILKKHGVKQATIMGEIAAVSSRGKPLHFNETLSITRDPTPAQEKMIDFFPFELTRLNGKEVSKTYDDYKKSFDLLKKWFGSSKYVYPVDSKVGKVSDINAFWKRYVEKEKNEGIVVRTSDGRVIKSKPTYTFDLGVIGIQEGTGKNKGTMGALILGFFDGKRFYRVINLGVGFSDADRKKWWSLAQKNKVSRDGRVVWVNPFKLNKVIETKYERLNVKPVQTYEFDKSKKEWTKGPDGFAATISKPDFVKLRDDKDVDKGDLRLTQIPDFDKQKKIFDKKTNSEQIVRVAMDIQKRLEKMRQRKDPDGIDPFFREARTKDEIIDQVLADAKIAKDHKSAVIKTQPEPPTKFKVDFSSFEEIDGLAQEKYNTD